MTHENTANTALYHTRVSYFVCSEFAIVRDWKTAEHTFNANNYILVYVLETEFFPENCSTLYCYNAPLA